VQPQKTIEIFASTNITPQFEVIQSRKTSAIFESIFTQPPTRGKKGIKNLTTLIKDHDTNEKNFYKKKKITKGKKIVKGESEKKNDLLIKKLKGVLLNPKKKRKRIKAAITRIAKLKAKGIKKELNKEIYNKVILSPIKAF